MASQKTIELYVYVDGINDVPFYGDRSGLYEQFILNNGELYETKDGFIFNVKHTNEQIKIGSFRYDAKRMGGAPTITFSLMYEVCLDKFWSDHVYAKFNGEKYYLKQTPTSSKNNDDARYKHDVELVAERTILDNTYFYDAVVGDPLENDVPVTNSTKFNFYGHIERFVERMNASLQYTGLQKVDEEGNVVSGYHVVLDNDVVIRDQKQVSFDSAVFSQALQESYNTFGIPFYFDGQTIHVGFSNNIIDDVLEYGVDGALISATKTNANFKVVNRATGNGSSDNIPYYYPNNSPKGELEAVSSNHELEVTIEDYEKYSNGVKIDEEIEYIGFPIEELGTSRKEHLMYANEYPYTNNSPLKVRTGRGVGVTRMLFIKKVYAEGKTTISFSPYFSCLQMAYCEGNTPIKTYDLQQVSLKARVFVQNNTSTTGEKIFEVENIDSGASLEIGVPNEGTFYIISEISLVHPPYEEADGNGYHYYATIVFDEVTIAKTGWYRKEGERINLEDIGLSLFGDERVGDTITQRLVKRINTSSTLQPSIYRATDGKERFYNAINYPFAFVDGYELKYGEYILDGEVHNDAYKKDDGTYYEFTNEYKEGRPREHVFTVDDIKPTIKEMTNNISWVETDEEGNDKTVFQRIDMFSEFAYNIGDNDETYTDPNGDTSFKHPYFFAKLRKLDFNLFEHASELGEMTFSMTSGNCGACNFKIGVSEDYPQYNTVQVWEKDTVDENGVFHAEGSLKYDENGYVLCGLEDFQDDVEWQDRQQDTVNYEVWIALKKEEDTYGILMPKAPVDGVGGHRPVACSSENANDGDTFVIVNINLPDEYIYKAEKKLEKSIVKYIWENNIEKFNFSVNFSRIFLEENPSILGALNENARLTRVKYNGDEYILYVSSYSYSMNEGDVLPEVRVELDDTLTIAQNALQNAINSVKSDIASAINGIDVATIGSRYFLRKDTYDVAEAPIEFKKGVVFGDNGIVEVNEDGTSKLTIDYLDVTRKATFTSLEIQEQSHVGGQILITPASMVCNGVEELEDAYRCYFETHGEGGEEIFNQFIEGDQAISQTFNEWGGHYYWRLVTGTGRNYIDLSKTDCAPESDIPSVGDKIIQLGNREDKTRQAAQVLSSYGEDSPSFIMYNGINDYSLEGKNVTGIIWNPSTQEPQMYSYGSFFFGDRELEDNYITFQQREGDTKKSLNINANISIGKNSTGLSNLSEWSTKQAEIDTARQTADTAIDNASRAQKAADDAQEFANQAQQTANTVNASVLALDTRINGVDQSIAEINNKLDGVVESYFDDYTPSRQNEPAATWITEGTEADHVGDTFTNTELTGDNAGKSWRWLEQADGTYDWQQIADSDAAKALALAGQAKAAADGKTKTFLVTPSNYSDGDIWIVGDSVPENFAFKKGDILTTNNDSTNYIASHWYKFINYNDAFQEELDEKVGKLENSISEAEKNAKDYTDQGKLALQGSIDELNQAKANAIDVYTKAEADGKISAAEQRAIQAADNYAKEAQEYAEINSKAYADGVADQAELDAIAQAKKELDEAKRILDDAIEDVDEKANKALDDAANAQKVADEATARMNEWTSDGIISPMEKQALKNEVANVQGDFEDIEKQFQKYIAEFETLILIDGEYYITEDGYTFNVLVANTNWLTFKNAKQTYVAELNSKINTQGNVSVGDLSIKQTAYYNARTSILEDISLAIKAEADYSKQTARSASSTANAAQELASSASTIATSASTRLSNWASDRYISPVEKQGIREELQFVTSDKATIVSELTQYDLIGSNEYQDYMNAVDTYVADLNRILNNTSDSVPVQYLLTYQEEFYAARTMIVNLIAETSKAYVDGVSQRVSDAEYLSNAMKNGQTIVDNGLVMSSMVAVADTEQSTQANVEAFLNGSNFARSDDYGKLILAAGIEDGSSDFETRAKNATTRIYESGIIDTNWLLSDYGRIGPFHIDNTKFKTNNTTSSKSATMVLTRHQNETGIGFVASNASNKSNFTFSVGNRDSVTRYDNNDDNFEKISESDIWYYDSCVNIDLVTDKKTTSHTDEVKTYTDSQSALRISAKNSSGDDIAAIRCPHGFYEGFRPKTTYYRYSSEDNNRPGGSRLELTEYDYNVLAVGSDGSTTSIILPKNPQNGQCYNIWKWGNGITIIKASHDIVRIGVSDYFVGPDGYSAFGIDNTYQGVIMIVWDEPETRWLSFLPTLRS